MTVTDEQTAEASEALPSPSLAARLSRRFPRAGVMLVAAALVFVLNGLHVHEYTSVSPFDENLHIDQLVRYSRFDFVQVDDGLSQEAKQEIACRGSQVVVFPSCGALPYHGNDFSLRGWNTASSAPPYYYFTTGVTARALSAPFGNGIVNWGRVLGSVWLLVGIYLVVRASEYFAISRLTLLFGVAIVIATPSLLHASNTINSDATAFVSGAAVLLAGLGWERRRVPLWVLGLAAAFCAMFDSTNALGVMVVLFYFLVRAIVSRRRQIIDGVRPWRDYLVAGVVAAGSAAAAVLTWRIVYGLVSHDVDLTQTDQYKAFHIDHLQLKMVFGKDTLFAIFPPVSGYVPPVLTTTAYSLFTQAAVFLMVGLLIAAAVRTNLGDRLSSLGAATLAALVVTPMLFVIYNFVSASQYFPILARNGLAAFPAILIVAAAVPRTRFGVSLLGVAAAGLYASAVVALV